MIIDANVARAISNEHNDTAGTDLLDKVMEELIIPRAKQGYMCANWEFLRYDINTYNPVFKRVVEMLNSLGYETELLTKYNYIHIKW